jgi:hypothetical protein
MAHTLGLPLLHMHKRKYVYKKDFYKKLETISDVHQWTADNQTAVCSPLKAA